MSNYINSLSSMHRYQYTNMTSRLTKANQVPLVYGQRTSSNTSYVNTNGIQGLSGMTLGAKSLQSALEELGNAATYQKSSVTSSSKAHVEVSTSGDSKDFTPVSISVEQVATGQVNQGTALRSNATFASYGTQQFEIEIDGKAHQFSLQITAGDTNQSVQQKMAAAINQKNIGIVANVSQNSSDKTSALQLSTTATGNSDKSTFAIRDRVGSSVVAQTGAATIKQGPRDAIFTVNGTQQTSQSNVVDLGDGVKATLRKETTETVQISRQVNNDYAMDKVKEMVDSFNKLWGTAQQYAGTNSRLHQDLSSALQAYGPALERLGIQIGKTGSLSINQSQLAAAMEQPAHSPKSAAEAFFTQSSTYGFTSRVARIAGQAQSNPALYVGGFTGAYQSGGESYQSYVERNNGDIFQMLGGQASYLKSYNQYMNMGFFLDMFI